jgi:polysaccharide chain length determinant protein (PEP-CTERM system associated)
MPEELEQEELESIDWQRYLGIARRRTWYFLLPLFTVWLIVWIASWMMPAIYRSGTLILVEQPSVPQALVASNIDEDMQNRLNTITQQILSRTRLLHIIDQFDLYPKERAHGSQDELVARMQKDINIELDHSDHGELTAFRIEYSSRDPRLAQQVTSELTSLFINENLEVRQNQSKATTDFLSGQLEEARQALATQEEKVREFNQQHLGELPGQLQSNIEILRGLQSQLEAEQAAFNAAKERNAYLESLLGQYKALERPGKASGTGTGTAMFGLAAIDQELDRLRAQLADLSSRYTDEYPDVRKVKDQIAKTEREKQQMEDQSKSAPPQAVSPDTNYSAQTAGPVLELQSQLKANQIEINNRNAAIEALQARINQYQSHLHDAPLREQQLTEITRGYDQSKADYDALLKKKNDSALATSLEYQQQGEHFSIQDPPNLPTKPDSPNRIKLFALGLAMGIALGAVCALGVEFLDNRIFSEAEFKKLVPTDVMVEIPPLPTRVEEEKQKRDTWLKWSVAGGVAFSLFVAFAITFLRG